MKTKHTIGPWHPIEDGDRYRIATEGNIYDGGSIGSADNEDDAEIMAAGPELLDALIQIHGMTDDPKYTDPVSIRAFIEEKINHLLRDVK